MKKENKQKLPYLVFFLNQHYETKKIRLHPKHKSINYFTK